MGGKYLKHCCHLANSSGKFQCPGTFPGATDTGIDIASRSLLIANISGNSRLPVVLPRKKQLKGFAAAHAQIHNQTAAGFFKLGNQSFKEPSPHSFPLQKMKC